MDYKRNYGVDLLRMIAMFMIVILHINYHGGLLDSLIPGTTQYKVVWLGEIVCYCAVNCYALISGYVGVYAKFRFKNIVGLWCRVEFYSLFITIFCMLRHAEYRTLDNLLRAFLPVTSMQYWYFSAYVGMFLFIPVMNKALECLEKRQVQMAIFGSLLFVCVLQHIFTNSVYSINSGYSVLWLSLLYMLGGYLRKYSPQTKKYNLLLYLGGSGLIVLFIWSYKVGILNISCPEEWILSYTAPGIVLISVLLLLFCVELKINVVWQRIISTISPFEVLY